MMLKELYDLAQREQLVADADYEPQRISFIVVIGKGGKLRSIVSTLTPPPNGKGKPTAKHFRIPRGEVRSSGVKAQFLWDNAKYVFGVNVDKARKIPKADLDECRKTFRLRVREAADASRDAALADVAAFLANLDAAPWTRDELQQRCGVGVIEPNANFAFRHESDPEGLVSDRTAVRKWWAARRQGTPNREIRCLVTAEVAPPIGSHPKIKKLWGGQTSGVALVSFNDVAFESYGLSGNENAPIGRPAAEAVAAALNRLLDRDYPSPIDGTPMPARSIRIAEDTTVLYWSRDEGAQVDLFGGGLDADPQQVKALYEAPHGGRPPALEDDSPFFALALSGEMARAKVRGWYETTLGRALVNARTHFDDVDVVRRDAEPLPLWRLLQSLALLGERKNLEPGLAAATFGAIIEGRPYPRALLQGGVRRARAEREVTAERAAVIKAYLARARRKGLVPASFPEVTPHMDTTSINVPYRLGRLFAALEKLQEEALPGANTTIRDRFFGAASATPVTVFPRLVRGAQPHLGKVKRGVYFEKLIQEIVAPVARFPSHLSLEEQGLFTLGYYHQRQDFFTKKDDAASAQ
jgi:CRISPR-associated protein Csd1